MGRYAVGYNFFYVAYRILTEMKPKNILEIGLGQSTILLGAYAANYRGVNHYCVENNEMWKNFFLQNHTLSANTKICICNLCSIKKFRGGYIPTYYDEKMFSDVITNKTFNLIVVDGPTGDESAKAYNRMDILSYIPDILCEEFVILIHDYDRKGEVKMVNLLKKKLEDNKIDYSSMLFLGENNLYAITSRRTKYLITV